MRVRLNCYNVRLKCPVKSAESLHEQLAHKKPPLLPSHSRVIPLISHLPIIEDPTVSDYVRNPSRNRLDGLLDSWNRAAGHCLLRLARENTERYDE